MSRLTRDGTAEPFSRDQILKREQGHIYVFTYWFHKIRRERNHRAFSEFLESYTDEKQYLLFGLNHSPSSSRHAEVSMKLLP